MENLEKYMFRYIDAVTKNCFKDASEILNDLLEKCDEETNIILKGFIDAANTLEALKIGEFDMVEDLWNSYEKSKKYISPKNRYYSIYLEISLIVEDLKETIEKII